MSLREQVRKYLATAKSPVQLVKHMDEVLEKNIKYPLIAQHKYDGVYVLVVVTDGIPTLYSRTGKEYFEGLYNTDFVMSLNGITDGVYIGELCNSKFSLEVFNGLISTNRKKSWEDSESQDTIKLLEEHTFIMFHDYIFHSCLLEGYCKLPYASRYELLHRRLNRAELLDYIVISDEVMSREDADAYAQLIIDAGGEGAVFKHPDEDWVAGHKGYRTMKIVRDLVLDLLCVGVEYGKGKRQGQIAKLQFAYKGTVFSADLGKGWTDERRIELTKAYEAGFHPVLTAIEQGCGEPDPVNKIWEVKALQESSTGKALRLPKVVRVREDKDTPDA